MTKLACRSLITAVAATVLTGLSVAASAQTPPPNPVPVERRPGLVGERLKELAHAHDGYYGALAPQNLAKKRPKPPFDFTSTWFVDLTRAFADFRFGPPYPEFYEAGQTAMKEAAAAQKAGQRYRDSIGECYPAGMPMIMTRVWPTSVVQLPTVTYMISGFMNSLRVINMDGRPHTDPDLVVRTFNGDSIGKFDGDALVIDTNGFIDHHHWIDNGIPASDALHIVERVRLVDGGKKMQIEYTMTDPKSWEGEWKVTKQWNRVDSRDMEIAEVECLPDLNSHIPSTQSKQNVR